MTSPSSSTHATRPRSASNSALKAKRKSTSLPPETVDYLKRWMMSPEHIAHPYPTEQEKAQIMQDTGIELKQLTNWFVNNRKRYWKPRVEAQLQSQSPTKERGSPHKKSPCSPSILSMSKVISSSSVASLDKSRRSATPTVTPLGSPSRFISVSEASSTASDSGSVSSADDNMQDLVGEQEHTIRIDLHILKPVSGKEPTEEDMTTLSNIPSDRILRTFQDCYISYSIPSNATLLQEQSRRDAELMQLKKKLLRVYFAETNGDSDAAAAPISKKRSTPASALMEAVDNVAPRPKYRRASLDAWKIACQTASGVYDESLPSLEEATQLFGYYTPTNISGDG